MKLYRDHAVVLRTYRLREADRIVNFVTEGHGKVRAVAKGVRKTKSKFGARLEPGSHIAAQFYEGRELDIVTQVDSIDHFRAVRDDLQRLGRAMAMLEVVDQVAQEGESNPGLYRMLVGALRTLDERSSPLVGPAFFWKVLVAEGFGPGLDACVACGSDVDLVTFDIDAGGVRCEQCGGGRPLSDRARVLLSQIAGGQLGAALNEPESAVTREVEDLATEVLEHHLERRLRSVGVLGPA